MEWWESDKYKEDEKKAIMGIICKKKKKFLQGLEQFEIGNIHQPNLKN
jgi:hypothetical protein